MIQVGRTFRNFGQYQNMDPLTIGAITAGIGAIGSAVGGAFDWLAKKEESETVETQAQLQAIQALENRKKTTNLILGGVILLAAGVAAIVIVKKIGKK